jgi:beta-lactamase regulating signal transducer with metallopeptidase domain
MKPLMSQVIPIVVSGSLVLSILLKVTATAILWLGLARLAGRSRASVRHALLSASFALLMVLPVVSFFAPSLRVHVPVPAAAETVRASYEYPASVAWEDSAQSVRRFHLATVPASQGASRASLLFAVWAAGAVLFLLPVAAGLWQTRRLRRAGIPWRAGKTAAAGLAAESGVRRSVQVLLHETVSGPMTCGTLRPAILLPVDAVSWDGKDLLTALIHELEHVRRQDWITRCLARALCGIYWFHPLAWITWRQFVLEAERACDDAVLRRSEATAYADQLVVLAQRLLNGPSQPILAMANRYDLAKRIAAVLDSRQRRGRAGVTTWGLACALSLVLVTLFSPIYIVARIQSPSAPADGRKFDVASVKPCRDEDFRNGDQRRQESTFSPGRITINCIPLSRIVYFAYAGVGSMDHPLLNDSPGEPSHVRGGPRWIGTETYYIEAKAEGTPERTVMMGPMLRALLEDRFKLKTHRELEEVPMYALTVAKGGLKIQPLGEDGAFHSMPPEICPGMNCSRRTLVPNPCAATSRHWATITSAPGLLAVSRWTNSPTRHSRACWIFT